MAPSRPPEALSSDPREAPMTDQQHTTPDTRPHETTPAEFVTRLKHLQAEVDQLETSLRAIVDSTNLGRRFRKEAYGLRPTLPKNEQETPAETIIHTFEAEAILEKLVSDTRFGKNASTYLWTKLGRHPKTLHDIYPAIIEIARTKEKERGVPASVKQRIRTIRNVIEREYELEKYVEWRDAEIKKRSALASRRPRTK